MVFRRANGQPQQGDDEQDEYGDGLLRGYGGGFSFIIEFERCNCRRLCCCFGWAVPPNTSFYSEWAASKTFQIGDGLVFNWTGDHNVGGVASKEEYDNCIDPGIVFGPGVRIAINSTDSLYFICTVGDHCERGQKVTITVGSAANNSAPPPPPPSYASSLTPTTLGSFIISTLVAISFLNHS
ncbi:hypothetical protein PRUPE_7G246500 [Prunus persica]|uniref:Phytocyanin domain-containing protein n=1 Tax=Prunus persica TaxID=3760 RepID=A0A251NGB4_PRUPE|nr:hypothetical protein PRUPE_7G246500 [Prunus persica]